MNERTYTESHLDSLFLMIYVEASCCGLSSNVDEVNVKSWSERSDYITALMRQTPKMARHAYNTTNVIK